MAPNLFGEGRKGRAIPPEAPCVFQGTIFNIYQWQQTMYDGSQTTFEMLSRPDTVQVIATDVEEGVVILDQEQPGSPPFISLPGGRVDEGDKQDPLTAGARELLEETGFASDTWEILRSERPLNKIMWVIHTCIARGVRRVAEPRPDAGERISVRRATFEEFLLLADNPLFRHNDMRPHLLRARYQPEAREHLRAALFG